MTLPMVNTTDAEGLVVPDLDATFGRRYRVVWSQDRSGVPAADLPSLREVKCHGGSVYPYGAGKLAAWSIRRGIGAKLRRLPFVLKARGDLETVIVFPVEHVAEVFALLKPYRRKQLSEGQREVLRQRLDRNVGRVRQIEGKSTLEPTNAALDVPAHVPGLEGAE